MAPDGTWWQLMAPGGNWWHLMAPGGTWWHLMAIDGTWWHLMAPDGNWWHLVAPDDWWHDGTWWHLVVAQVLLWYGSSFFPVSDQKVMINSANKNSIFERGSSQPRKGKKEIFRRCRPTFFFLFFPPNNLNGSNSCSDNWSLEKLKDVFKEQEKKTQKWFLQKNVLHIINWAV